MVNTENAEKTEKKIIIGIDVKGKNFNHKAKHAMVCLRNEIQKHFRTTNFVISTEINKFVWSEGRANAPTKIPVIGVTKNNKVFLFLDGSEADKKNMDVVLGKAIKEDSKEKKKQETDKKEEHEHKKETVHNKHKDIVGASEKKIEKKNQESKKEKEKKGIK